MANENLQQNKNKETPILVDNFKWKIPICCEENWDSCPHVIKKQRPAKRNIGL